MRGNDKYPEYRNHASYVANLYTRQLPYCLAQFNKLYHFHTPHIPFQSRGGGGGGGGRGATYIFLKMCVRETHSSE